MPPALAWGTLREPAGVGEGASWSQLFSLGCERWRDEATRGKGNRRVSGVASAVAL